MSFIRGASVLLIASSVLLSACGMGHHASADGQEPVYVEGENNGMFSHMFHKKHPSAQAAAQAGIGVNSYLWRATLDTLSFMPLGSADPWGGVITTDWYVNPEKPDERFKCTVYILDTRLRGDAIKVTVFKEVSNGQGGWGPSPVANQTPEDIENAILTRARQLRLSNLRG
jgi:hypothetical protein